MSSFGRSERSIIGTPLTIPPAKNNGNAGHHACDPFITASIPELQTPAVIAPPQDTTFLERRA
jgi:hypothetical protein